MVKISTKVYNGLDLQNQRIVSLSDPSAATDAATKQYVDALIAGLSWKRAVRVASVANVNLTTDVDAASVFNGVTLAQGDRILLKDQTAQAQNGVYVVPATSGTAVRATDVDSTDDLRNATVMVREGSVGADTAWTQTAEITTVDTTNQTWVQFGAGGGATYTADGQGIEVSANQFSLELDGTTLSKSATGLRVGSGAAGAGITEASGVLAVNPGTGLEISGDTVRIAASAAGAGLTGGGGSALAVDTSTVARKESVTNPGTANPWVITHGLGTKDVHVSIREVSTDAFAFVDAVATSTTQVTLTFATAPTTGQYRVTLVG